MNVVTSNNVVTINKREFLLYPNRYIKMLSEADKIVVTNRGEIEFVVTKTTEQLEEKFKLIGDTPNTPRKFKTTYGCGCEKEQGKFLCQKHGRY